MKHKDMEIDRELTVIKTLLGLNQFLEERPDLELWYDAIENELHLVERSQTYIREPGFVYIGEL